jgi:hypothetical protein
MPAISIFFGIVIKMFYREHGPHFHAEYQGQRATFDFNGKILRGNIRSKTALRLIQEWAMLHRVELEQNWHNIIEGRPLSRIAPLD